MIKNQYVLFAVALLAIASTALNVALFVSERGNEHRLRELNQRIDQLEFRQLPSLEERLSQIAPAQAVLPETETSGGGAAQ
ncbi:MAG: hypothetical protein V2J55_11360 [Candidatus Competibacteraceae bacterium]|jgi:hypothetical protein|nr:hypothetical protein [Candidatus Competibacteraceae bacterium]